MRILYIVTAFPRHEDDVITPWMSETIHRLGARGIEVEVLAPSYRGLRSQTVGGTRVHRFRYAPAAIETLTHDQTTPDRLRDRPVYFSLVPSYLLAGSLAAARLARSGRFDAVHAFWPLPHGLFAMAARGAGRIPLVSTFFGVEVTWARRGIPFLAPVVRRIARGSDAVTVISTYTASELRRMAPEAPVEVIPFGAALTPEAAPETFGFGAAADPLRILFVGRLVERKGVDVLLRAASLLPPDSEFELTIVGDGPERERLEALTGELAIRGRVRFAGNVPAPDLRREYAACDLFVLPAVRDSKGDVEGLGVVLLEALLHGKPVIASRSGGIPDIVEHEKTGLLVQPADPGALAEAIRRLRADPDLARRLARSGFERAVEKFSWNRVIDDLVSVYGRVIGPPGRRSPAVGPAR